MRMNKLNNILVTLPLDKEQKVKIESISPASQFTYRPASQVEESEIGNYDAILGNVPVELLKHAEQLKWNRLGGVGTEGYDQAGAMPEKAVLTNAAGAYGRAVAGQAFGMLWTLMKKLHLYRDNQNRHIWKPLGQVQSVEGKTALLLGFGDIGRTFASYLKPFDVHIIGVNTSGKSHPLADEMYTLAELNQLIPQADIIMISLPGTSKTEKIMGREQLNLMKETAILLNVGRGMTVDLDALCQIAGEGRIWGAGLDVLAIEPLPAGHPAWTNPNILISPHVAGGFYLPYTLEQVVEITCKNLKAYQEGQFMQNVIVQA